MLADVLVWVVKQSQTMKNKRYGSGIARSACAQLSLPFAGKLFDPSQRVAPFDAGVDSSAVVSLTGNSNASAVNV